MLYLTIIGGAFIAWLILALLFTPHIPYHIEARRSTPRSDHFIHVLESTCQTHLEHGNRVEILTNGDTFYPAMLDAIRGARETINMECYIFKKGEIGDAFIDALCERARAGVRVTHRDGRDRQLRRLPQVARSRSRPPAAASPPTSGSRGTAWAG